MQDVYEYITSERASFQTPIDIMGWDWCFPDHVKRGFYYKHGRLETGNTDYKPIKNIVRPILNLQYRSEDLDVKDINIYIDSPQQYHKSFLVKKYYDEVFLKKFDMDTFLDQANESRVDYGGALLKNMNGPRPEVVPLETIAFCDQTDILSNPICLRHYYSPDKLKEMGKSHWGDPKHGATITIDELIELSREVKESNDGKQSKTPGKQIEVFELQGVLPEKWLDKESTEYTRQTQIVAFYTKKDGLSQGVILYRGTRKDNPFKFIVRDPIYGRALGFGGVEELTESQVWTNYAQLKFRQLLDAAAETILKTNDGLFARQQQMHEFNGMKLAVLEEGKDLSQVDTFPRNINLFQQSIQEWEAHAQMMGAANDSILGESPASGTPFKLQELVTREAHSLHEFRRGKFAKDIEAVYRDWVIPHIAAEIKKDQSFLATLTLDEMQFISERWANHRIDELYRAGQLDLGTVEEKKQELIIGFMKDNRKFITWVKGEMDNVELSIEINISGKQKDLYLHTDKLVNIFRQISAAPQLLDDPRMAKIFNQILESSGLEPVDFSSYRQLQPVTNTQPLQELNNKQQEYGDQQNTGRPRGQ